MKKNEIVKEIAVDGGHSNLIDLEKVTGTKTQHRWLG